MKKNQTKTFEDCINTINESIQKQKAKWQLTAINWFDFQDVEQMIRVHIYSKWHMWDQSRPLEPWLSIVIRNQIYNIIRNHYGNYVRPCIGCTFCVDEHGCSITKTKTQNSECRDYAKWESGKKAALDLKMSLSAEHHSHEISSMPQQNFEYEPAIERLNAEMEKVLSPLHYKAYMMLYFEQKTEEEVAHMMGYKTSEKKRKAGYRQIKNLKKMFLKKASEIIKELDIIIDEINK